MQEIGIPSTGGTEHSYPARMPAPLTVSVPVGQGYVVSATVDGFSVGRNLPPSPPQFDAITRPELLRQVFAGAFQAAARHLDATARRIERAETLMSYVYGLLSAYQTTRATSPLLTALAARFAACGRYTVADRCLTLASEESGHDTLALRDLDALGYPAAALVNTIRPRRALAMVDLFFSYAAAEHPIRSFGYAYALKHTAVFADEARLRNFNSILPAGVTANRCFGVHGTMGAEPARIRDCLVFAATLGAEDQARIVQGIFETLCVMHDPDLDDYPGDGALAAQIAGIVQNAIAENRSKSTHPPHHLGRQPQGETHDGP